MDRRFKILSLDGGGVRGYLSLLLLKKIEDFLNSKTTSPMPIGKRFHLITGTSTGSIIATLLASGKYVQEILNIYDELIPSIFKKQTSFPSIYTKYNSRLLAEEAQKLWGDKTLHDLEVDIMIPTVDLITSEPNIYRSEYYSYSGANEKIADIIVASSSAPTFFSPTKELSDSFASIDGGLVANNPTLLAFIDLLNYNGKFKNYDDGLPISIENTIIVSLGTGINQQPDYNPEKLLEDKGKLQWAKSIIHILFENQSKLVTKQVEMLMNSRNNSASYKRINPVLTMNIELDDIEKFKMLKSFASIEDEDYLFFERCFL